MNLHRWFESIFVKKPFRIPRSVVSNPEVNIKALEDLNLRISQTLNELCNKPKEPTQEESIVWLADLITELWRIRRRTIDPATQQPLEQMKPISRRLESIFEILNQEGIEIVDRVNRKYDVGFVEKVLTHEKRDNLSYPIISETVKPTIFYKNQLLQRGEIIVAIPEQTNLNEVKNHEPFDH